MSSKQPFNLTARDTEILTALIQTPLDTKQLMTRSYTFASPFFTEKNLQRRMRRLKSAGLIRTFAFALGGANYYKPTKLGYKLIQGPAAPLPPTTYFGPISISLQQHARVLGDFIVKTHLNARQNQIAIENFYRENQLRLNVGGHILQPDCAFELQVANGRSSHRTYRFFVEIDCGTEPLRSTKQRDSLEQKLRLYNKYQDSISDRFRVLFLFGKASERVSHFVTLADKLTTDPQRSLIFASTIAEYVSKHDSMCSPLFIDRFRQSVALVPNATLPTNVANLPKNKSVYLVSHR